MKSTATLAFLLLQTPHLINALGINCRGSSECDFATTFHANYLTFFNQTLSTVQTRLDNNTYSGITSFTFHAGDQIICRDTTPGGICLYLQGPTIPFVGVNGSFILEKLTYLIEHGCHICGSVPISGDNNEDTAGKLTANYVMFPACDGYCAAGQIIEFKNLGPPSGDYNSYALGYPAVNRGAG